MGFFLGMITIVSNKPTFASFFLKGIDISFVFQRVDHPFGRFFPVITACNNTNRIVIVDGDRKRQSLFLMEDLSRQISYHFLSQNLRVDGFRFRIG